MRHKLGLPDGVDDTVVAQVADDLLAHLERDHVDYTSFFRTAERGGPWRCGTWTFDDEWVARWLALGRTPTPWIASTPSTSRATTSSRRPSPPHRQATWIPLERLLAAITSPYEERPGFERYAEPAPDDFGCYRTFCGT